MALNTFNAQSSLYVDEILVYGENDLYGAKVLETVWVSIDGVETKFYITQTGKVVGNEFVLNKGKGYVSLDHKESLASYYSRKWTKDRFTEGQFLRGSDYYSKNKTFYFESEDKVWSLQTGKVDTLKNRELDYGQLVELTTEAGTPFRKIVKENKK